MCTCVVYVCTFIWMCVGRCVCQWRSEVDIECFPLHINFWDRVSNWTWSKPNGYIGWLLAPGNLPLFTSLLTHVHVSCPFFNMGTILILHELKSTCCLAVLSISLDPAFLRGWEWGSRSFHVVIHLPQLSVCWIHSHVPPYLLKPLPLTSFVWLLDLI